MHSPTTTSTVTSPVVSIARKSTMITFTTLRPRIGTVERDYEVITVADLPGLLEGAHEGRGLGDRFLRHIERTRVLLHLVDASEGGPDNWEQAWRSVRLELESFGGEVMDKPELVLLTKTALRSEPVPVAEVAARLGRPVQAISAQEGQGLDSLVPALFRLVQQV